MNTQQRLRQEWVKKAVEAYKLGDVAEGDRCMHNARTLEAPVGALIAQTYN